MAYIIPVKYLKELGDLIGDGYRRFGKVTPRRPYREEDDDEGGSGGGSELVFEEHPFLKERPTGAPTDLTYIMQKSMFSAVEAEKRYDEATPQLTKKLNYVLGLDKQKKATPLPLPNPYGGN